MVVANKTDLRREQMVLGRNDVEALQKELKCPVIECSARFDADGKVTKAFEEIIMVIERGPPKPAEPAGGGKCLMM